MIELRGSWGSKSSLLLEVGQRSQDRLWLSQLESSDLLFWADARRGLGWPTLPSLVGGEGSRSSSALEGSSPNSGKDRREAKAGQVGSISGCDGEGTCGEGKGLFGQAEEADVGPGGFLQGKGQSALCTCGVGSCPKNRFLWTLWLNLILWLSRREAPPAGCREKCFQRVRMVSRCCAPLLGTLQLPWIQWGPLLGPGGGPSLTVRPQSSICFCLSWGFVCMWGEGPSFRMLYIPLCSELCAALFRNFGFCSCLASLWPGYALSRCGDTPGWSG